MNHLINKYLLSTFCLATSFSTIGGLIASASAETTSKPCPYSCRTIGQANSSSCKDYRRGNTCFVETDGSSSNVPSSSSSSGGQKICVSAAGSMVTRGNCRSSETRLSLTNLPSFADIALASVPSGETIYGVIGQTLGASATSQALSSQDSLNAVLTVPLGINDVVIASTAELITACGSASTCLSAEEQAVSSICTGTVAAATAPSGKVCIYLAGISNATELRAIPVPASGASTGISLNWTATNVGSSTAQGVWAYTAP